MLWPPALSFDQAGPTRAVTLVNTSTVPLQIRDVFIPTASGAFQIAGSDCLGIVAARGSCKVTIALQAKSGEDTLRFTDSAGRQDVSLSAG